MTTRRLAVRRLPQHFDAATDPGSLPEGGPDVWGDRCCGVACVRMLLDFYQLPMPDPAEMLRRGLQIQAYGDRGWIHARLVQLAERYGLTGVVVRATTLPELDVWVAQGVAPIVSATFRFPQDGRRGGHLVVFTGTTMVHGRRMARFADPSRWGADHDIVPAERFWASCTGSVIALWPVNALTAMLSAARIPAR